MTLPLPGTMGGIAVPEPVTGFAEGAPLNVGICFGAVMTGGSLLVFDLTIGGFDRIDSGLGTAFFATRTGVSEDVFG